MNDVPITYLSMEPNLVLLSSCKIPMGYWKQKTIDYLYLYFMNRVWVTLKHFLLIILFVTYYNNNVIK